MDNDYDFTPNLRLEAAESTSFDDYTRIVINAIRIAKHQLNSHLASEAQNALNRFVMTHCLSRVQERINYIFRTYDITTMRLWMPDNNEFDNPKKMQVSHPLANTVYSLDSFESLIFNQENAKIWWLTICKALVIFKKMVAKKKVAEVVAVSKILHSLLEATPLELWECQSLADCLGKSFVFVASQSDAAASAIEEKSTRKAEGQ